MKLIWKPYELSMIELDQPSPLLKLSIQQRREFEWNLAILYYQVDKEIRKMLKELDIK